MLDVTTTKEIENATSNANSDKSITEKSNFGGNNNSKYLSNVTLETSNDFLGIQIFSKLIFSI